MHMKESYYSWQKFRWYSIANMSAKFILGWVSAGEQNRSILFFGAHDPRPINPSLRWIKNNQHIYRSISESVKWLEIGESFEENGVFVSEDSGYASSYSSKGRSMWCNVCAWVWAAPPAWALGVRTEYFRYSFKVLTPVYVPYLLFLSYSLQWCFQRVRPCICLASYKLSFTQTSSHSAT